jgi:Protein of unknown function (DUF1566)
VTGASSVLVDSGRCSLVRPFWLALAVVCAVTDVAGAGCAGASTRYVLRGGEAYDTRTGLTWQRCSVGMTWNAHAGCLGQPALIGLKDALKAAEAAGPGWRVPGIKELHSLLDKRCGTPPVDVVAFPDLKVGKKDKEDGQDDDRIYWTTSKLGVAGLVYYVDFTTGDVDAHSQGFSLAVRLVRTDM